MIALKDARTHVTHFERYMDILQSTAAPSNLQFRNFNGFLKQFENVMHTLEQYMHTDDIKWLSRNEFLIKSIVYDIFQKLT